MRGIVITIIVMFMLMWGCATCLTVSNTRTQSRSTTNINITSTAADGLDLKALGALVQKVKTAEELEREINKQGGVNNLDLNEDGKVDFITVTEYGNKQDEFGFSLTTEPVKGEVQEVANILIQKEQENVKVQVSGNQQIYGSGHAYSHVATAGSFLLMGYLLGGHSFYRPHYGWGAYPSYYRPYSSVDGSAYANRARGFGGANSFNRASAPVTPRSVNPNQGKVAQKGITKPLSNPTSTQKSFQARNPSKSVGKGGFGSNSARNRSSGRGFGGRGK